MKHPHFLGFAGVFITFSNSYFAQMRLGGLLGVYLSQNEGRSMSMERPFSI